jgi:hypothetical protein
MPLKIYKNRAIGAVLAFGALAAFGAADAQARIVELGQSDDEPVASCPEKPCLAVSRTTGFQKKVAGEEDLYTVPANGRIVAWTITLGSPTDKQVKFFNTTLGGDPSAGITVFRMGKKKKDRGIATSIGESGVQELTDYLGQTVQFPMAHTVRVLKGDRVALTVPTWAPALAVNFGEDTVWRATRSPEGCDDTSSQTAIQELGTETMFGCGYKTARLTYTATLITAPKPNEDTSSGDGKSPKRR